jgi:hypothetical protein
MHINPYHRTIHAPDEMNGQNKQLMRNKKTCHLKNQRQDHQETGTNEEPNNASLRPPEPCVPSNLDGGVVEVESGVIAKSRAPKSVRVLVLSVVDTVRVLGLVAVGVLRLVVGRVLRLLGLGVRVLRLVMGWILRLLAMLKLLAVWVLVLVVRLVPSALFASLLAHGEHFAKAVIGALLLLSAQEHKVASLWRELVQDHDRRGEGKLTSQCSGYSLQSMHSSSTKLQVGGDVGFAEGVDTEYGFS